ncbi:MAG: hypothetical protein LIP16_10155 [Clostridium sp.]|nr:hypothetical protein [Clostridium sp.]
MGENIWRLLINERKIFIRSRFAKKTIIKTKSNITKESWLTYSNITKESWLTYSNITPP